MAFENPFSRKKSLRETAPQKGSPDRLRATTHTAIEALSKSFQIDGNKNIERIREIQKENSNERFVIAASHLSNLDAPGAVEALGNDLDILITATSQSFGLTQQELLFRAAGRDNFLPLSHTNKTTDKEARAVFNPSDFAPIIDAMKSGKTPWIAAHEFTLGAEMKQAKTGSLYLAQKTGAYLIPTALEVRDGGSINLDGPKEALKGVLKKAELIYHVGLPYKPEPIDVEIIDRVITKRQRKEEITSEEREQFATISRELRAQADALAITIASLLPESMQGEYSTNENKM